MKSKENMTLGGGSYKTMFEQFIGSLEDDRFRQFYEGPFNDIPAANLVRFILGLEKDGFTRQSNGLYLRHPLSPEMLANTLTATILDIGFTRRSDAHYHHRMSEAFRVTAGEGALYLSSDEEFDRERVDVIPLSPGREHKIYPGQAHAFRPAEDGLRIFLVTDQPYTPDEETCVIPFNEVTFKPADCRDR